MQKCKHTKIENIFFLQQNIKNTGFKVQYLRIVYETNNILLLIFSTGKINQKDIYARYFCDFYDLAANVQNNDFD